MDELVDLALKAESALPAPLVEHLFELASVNGDRARLRLFAARDDLPYEVRKRLDIAPSAADMVSRVQSPNITADELDDLIDNDGRASVLTAIAGRGDLSLDQRQRVAACGHVAAAWALASRSYDLEPQVALPVVSTLVEAFHAGRSQPSRNDIAMRLAHADLLVHAIDRDDLPFSAVAWALRALDLHEPQMRHKLLVRFQQVADEVPVVTPANEDLWAGFHAAIDVFMVLCERNRDVLDVAARFVAERQDNLRSHADFRELQAAVKLAELTCPDDPYEVAAAADAALASTLLDLVSQNPPSGGIGQKVVSGLTVNRQLTPQQFLAVVDLTPGWLLVSHTLELAEACLFERAACLVKSLDWYGRLELLSCEADLPISLRRAALTDGPKSTVAPSRQLLAAAAKVGVLLELPVGIFVAAISDCEPATAAVALRAIYDELDDMGRAWPALNALQADFPGSLRELVETAGLLTD